MKVRTIAAATAATLALGGLAGCRTHVGAAATVGGYRISETRVNDFLTPTGAAPSTAAGQTQRTSPRAQVLQVLVQQRLFEKTLAADGGIPTAGVLSGSHDAATQLLLQTTLAGGALDTSLRKGLTRSGIRTGFAAVYLRTLEMEYALISRRKLNRLTELVALVGRTHQPVSVSRRYGVWVAAQLGIDSAGGVPGFLSLQPTPGVAASSSAAAAP